jgi:hypothetical protein
VVGKIKITQLIGTINIDLMDEVLIFGLILLCCKSMIKHTHIWAEDRGKELMVGTVQYVLLHLLISYISHVYNDMQYNWPII